jgi:hypothetical protein
VPTVPFAAWDAEPVADEPVLEVPVPETLELPLAPVLTESVPASACCVTEWKPAGIAARAKANALAVANRASLDRGFVIALSFHCCRHRRSNGANRPSPQEWTFPNYRCFAKR